MVDKLSVVSVLEQRIDFLDGITEVAKDCNWSNRKISELLDYLIQELIDIDNFLYDIYEETENRYLAFLTWENQMEDLRHWLSLILGIRIKYI